MAERLVWLIVDTFPVLILIDVWGNLEGTGRISHAMAGQLTLYYMLSLLISRAVSINFEQRQINNIKDGSISAYILRPMSHQVFLMAHEVMWRLTGLYQLVPILLLFLPRLFNIQGMIFHPTAVLLGVGFILFSFFLRFYVGWLITLLAFWFDQADAFIHVRWMAEGFFGGQWLPLSFFPLFARTIASWTPFYTWYFVPIQLITGTMSFEKGITYIWRTLAWFIVLFLFGQWAWKEALKKYSAVGG